jgi:hypothetical protein
MTQRSFDVVVLGASGHHGSMIAKYIAANSVFYKWAIAGPDYKQLTELISHFPATNTGGTALPDIVIVDATDVWALRDVLSEAWLAINCTPAALRSTVIETCIDARCNYMDQCNDIHVIDGHFLDFQLPATKKGVCIIHGCGFDSAIAELGVSLAISLCEPNTCNSIDSFLQIKGVTHKLPPMDSLLVQQKHKKHIKQLDSQIREKFKIPTAKHPGPKVDKKTPYYFDSRLNSFATPSVGTEKHMVEHAFRSFCYRNNQILLPQYHPYSLSDDVSTATSNSFYSSLFSSMGKYSMGRSIVRRLPEVLTDGHTAIREQPTAEQLSSSTFQMTIIVKGLTEPVEDEDIVHSDCDNDIDDSCESAVEPPVADAIPLRITKDMVAKTSTVSVPCSGFFFANPHKKSLAVDSSASNVSGFVPYEKWIIATGPEPSVTASTLLMVRLAQFFLRMRYGRIDEQQPICVNIHLSDGFGGVYSPAGIFHDNPFVYDLLADSGVNFEIFTPIHEPVYESSSATSPRRLQKDGVTDDSHASIVMPVLDQPSRPKSWSLPAAECVDEAVTPTVLPACNEPQAESEPELSHSQTI